MQEERDNAAAATARHSDNVSTASDLATLTYEELFARRQAIDAEIKAIDARIEEIKNDLTAKAERLGIKIITTKKKVSRRSRTQVTE